MMGNFNESCYLEVERKLSEEKVLDQRKRERERLKEEWWWLLRETDGARRERENMG